MKLSSTSILIVKYKISLYLKQKQCINKTYYMECTKPDA